MSLMILKNWYDFHKLTITTKLLPLLPLGRLAQSTSAGLQIQRPWVRTPARPHELYCYKIVFFSSYVSFHCAKQSRCQLSCGMVVVVRLSAYFYDVSMASTDYNDHDVSMVMEMCTRDLLWGQTHFTMLMSIQYVWHWWLYRCLCDIIYIQCSCCHFSSCLVLLRDITANYNYILFLMTNLYGIGVTPGAHEHAKNQFSHQKPQTFTRLHNTHITLI